MSYAARYERSLALLIGIDTYRDERLVPLAEAESDTKKLAAILSSAPYNFEVYTLLGTQATRANILDYLNTLEGQATADDRVLVYYAGHGYTLPDRFEQEIGYITAYDSDPSNHHTAIRMSDLTDFRRYTLAKHIAFILDACFSGSALGLTRTAQAESHLLQRSAFQVISAGAADQTVSDYYAMTRHLLAILQTPDSMLTVNRLGLRLQQTITHISNGTQIPQFGHLTGSEGGDMILYAQKSLDSLSLLPERLRIGLGHEDANVRYFAVAELERTLYEPDMTAVAQQLLEELATDDDDVEVRRRSLHALTRYHSGSYTAESGFETPHLDVTVTRKRDSTHPLPPSDREAHLVLHAKNTTKEIALRDLPLVFGRSTSADVVIEDSSVSRHHARIYQQGDTYYLQDMHSTNGTFVNGQRLEDSTRLTNGDRIQLAHTQLRFHQ